MTCEIVTKTELLPWQQQAFDKLHRLKVGALYMDMSTGKTRTALELVCYRLKKNKISHVIWLCPFNTVAEMPALFSQHVKNWENYITVVGIESLSASVRKNAELLALADREDCFLIVDESTLVKNPHALRTQNITTLAAKCPYRLILSGTPITKCEADLFSQWYILDWRILGYQSFWSFSANHLEYDELRPGKIRRVLHLDYLSEKIAPYTFEIKREDCFTLPPKKWRTFDFDMTRDQLDHYGRVSERLIGEIDESNPASIYRLFSALQTITSGFHLNFDLKGKYTKTPEFPNPADNPRLQALMWALGKLPDDEKVVINCKYTSEIETIMAALNAAKPGSAVPYFGEISKKHRAENLNMFRNNAQYLIANKSCSGYGLNLQFCHNMIFYNNDFDYATRLQAEDRLHRYGQEYNVNIFDIVCNHSIDVIIQNCMMNKMNLLDNFKNNLSRANFSIEAIRRMCRGLID
jgi:hypothetical protein